MTLPHSETIELQRAERGHDLWAAVEAAQYARIVDHEAPRTKAEAERMQDLIEVFSDCAEAWERKSVADQTVALERLGTRLAGLDEFGLCAYWTVVERRFETAEGETVALPVAVLAILRDGRPAVTLELPHAVGAD